MTRGRLCPWTAATVLLALLCSSGAWAQSESCTRTLHADVVAFDQVFFWNRLGAIQPQGMMYALRRDVMPISGSELTPGNVRLRPGKRPRPIVLRMNVGDCLEIAFENLLASTRRDEEQPATRWASIHVVGMQIQTIADDGSYVGSNASSLVPVGGSTTYLLVAPDHEGEHVMYSAGATNGGEGDSGSASAGLFGAVIVEPAGSHWYRSQVTRVEFDQLVTYVSGSTGYPVFDYETTDGAGIPILNMLDTGTNEILYTDLTAIITGSAASSGGFFASNAFAPNVTYPNRNQPFREFVILYHDEIGAVQAFPQFEDPVLKHTLQGGRDGFAINYGTGGIGAEILANRLGVGPMWNCTECKFEEFFLSAWAVGDPAMIVDVPANAPCMVSTSSPNTVGQDPNLDDAVDEMRQPSTPPCDPTTGAKATKAFFPDDPSNVYHSYLRDHVRFRVLHGGSKEHHIHHLHAHQWLYTADSDKSSYLDSQALGPGSSFTAEIAYEGGGNRNLTVGDSIFHCHFYPHFAQGMWSLWRVHDVLEMGTFLDENGRPEEGARALPDGEITAGTPIPGIIPLPGKPMAPYPGAIVSLDSSGQVVVTGTGNPGYPFFVPGVAGHRPPKPPLDTIDDGGLARHVIINGTYDESHDRLDFHKLLLSVEAVALPEAGTAVEQAAMAFHEQSGHPTCTPDGTCDAPGTSVLFATNGHPRMPGAPYADPCPIRTTDPAYDRLYKVADIQDDVKLNKKGWHFPQQRFSALWEDVDDFLAPFSSTKKPPEPLFFRANSGDCIEYWLTNLVPNEYHLDDFQVRTPTDVLGQHIHLVKFDVTASDGAANGFNYEDGSFSPDEVQERIKAIRYFNNCLSTQTGTFECPEAEPHPFFGSGTNREWLGAQTTVQRWWADPVLDNNNKDRTLRTVFTHDHFGPSTHQQTGLYAGLVVEPLNSSWKHNETGTPFYTRHDGGPTSWQAVISVPNNPDYREYLLEYGDYQLAYEEDSAACRTELHPNPYPGPGFPIPVIRCDDPDNAVNPPGREEIGLPDLLARPDECPGGVDPPCPEIISAADPGMMSVNYRNEPVALRVRNPATNGQASGQAGDLSYAFSSNVDRADNDFDVQPAFYAPLTQDLNGGDPFTPLLRAYENDRVQIRLLVGAHEEGHNVSVHGIKWLFEPSEPNSGYKNSQMMGISEHFEFIVPQILQGSEGDFVDRLYSTGSATDDYWAGNWGLLRTYSAAQSLLQKLPDKPTTAAPGLTPSILSALTFSCPEDAPVRNFDVTAVTAQNALGSQGILYNTRTDGSFGPLFDPTGLMYVQTADLNSNGTLPGWIPREPLILRARAGECIHLTLRNALPEEPLLDLDGFNTLPMIMPGFNNNDILPSNEVGLHPQLVYYDVSRFDGANVGGNAVQTVAPGQSKTYEWYAGDITVDPSGGVTATPIEFGATNLISSDRIKHASKGAIGALVIEPADSDWTEVDCIRPNIFPKVCPRAAVDVTVQNEVLFREFVILFQNDINMRTESDIDTFCPNNTGGFVSGYGYPLENLACEEDPEDSGQKAINYRTEPLWKRMQHAPGTPLTTTRNFTDWYDVVSNSKVGGYPVTPVFYATVGTPLRFRVLEPGGHARNEVFAVHGHIWDKEPYIQDSEVEGQNNFSFWEGARMGHGPTNHFDSLIRYGAGGKAAAPGDYLFRDQTTFGFDNGLWGLLWVCEENRHCIR
jgi:hypothetical protein